MRVMASRSLLWPAVRGAGMGGAEIEPEVDQSHQLAVGDKCFELGSQGLDRVLAGGRWAGA